MISFIKGSKGNYQILLNGYKFIKHLERSESTYWKCQYYDTGCCKARCITTTDAKLIINGIHKNHPPSSTIKKNYNILFQRKYNIVKIMK